MAQRSRRKGRDLASSPPLTAAQRGALARLREAGLTQDFYLAGGVAIAHHLRHRRSNDLDLFSASGSIDLDSVRHRLTSELGAQVVEQSDSTLKLKVGRAMVDLVRYPYALLARAKRGPEGVPVAALRDLAVMKLAAIARRGVRRDYWDLYEILTRSKITLRSTCADYETKFGVSEADLYHVLRSLTWFEDAEADPTPPRGLSRTRWTQIRALFETESARELLRRSK
jgi:hypothetical protein